MNTFEFAWLWYTVVVPGLFSQHEAGENRSSFNELSTVQTPSNLILAAEGMHVRQASTAAHGEGALVMSKLVEALKEFIC